MKLRPLIPGIIVNSMFLIFFIGVFIYACVAGIFAGIIITAIMVLIFLFNEIIATKRLKNGER